jgi:hypothetical protein
MNDSQRAPPSRDVRRPRAVGVRLRRDLTAGVDLARFADFAHLLDLADFADFADVADFADFADVADFARRLFVALAGVARDFAFALRRCAVAGRVRFTFTAGSRTRSPAAARTGSRPR